MVPYRPARVLVARDAWNDALTGEVLSRLKGIPVQTVESAGAALQDLDEASDFRSAGKRTLVLARHPGSFLKACPGSGAEICCNYYVLNYAMNCHMECTYCILQAYLDNPALVIFTNVDDMLREISARLQADPGRTFRIGTGEMADSLALDAITRISCRLVTAFADMPNAILELKTKTDCVDNLAGLRHRGRTVVSWSLNSRRICRTDELKTATFDERLAAARRCREWGYTVGFHFDPVVCYQGWEEEYREAVRDLFDAVSADGIAWISIGALRFTPHLREIMRSRFPSSRIPYGEFVPGHHGKLRYFRPIREEMYARIGGWIRERAPGVPVYLCMESRAAWQRSFSAAPADTEHLSQLLDGRVRCGR